MIRTIVSNVLEALGFVLIALALWFTVGWAWGLLPLGVYGILSGVTLGRDRE